MWKLIGLFIIINCFVVVHYASLINSQTVQCECFNQTSDQTKDVCKDNVTECPATDSTKPQACFVLWTTDNQTKERKVTMKGCFTNEQCHRTSCIDTKPLNQYHFCCCLGNMCNTEFDWSPTTAKPEERAPPPEQPNMTYILLICFACVFVVSVLFGVALFYKNKKNAMFNEVPTNEPDLHGSKEELSSHRPIQLIEMKARGRFGSVWRAQLKSDEIAVKIFPMQDKDSWQTEQDIFKFPRMRHQNILEYIGVEKHPIQSELWLITAYHSFGSLCDYLKAHTVTWPELCKIAESMSRGLMHLHEEIGASKSEGLKPSIAHRDFKSKNVLLKDDLTACIADFGLALVFHPDVPCGDTHGQVGTRRYMAPEVLEGAINFTRDAFLRIDVYACALVLWELASRCTAHGNDIPEFTLPFETELGPHPTLEEMQENIVIKKLRPAIPDHWRTHSGLNAMCDTIEECWDHDAEARLTASCVIERVSHHIRYPKTELYIEANNDTSLKDSLDSTEKS